MGGSQNKVSVKKKEEINALVCGTNQTLTDTMLYVNYNVNTGKVAMMSIPRDTYITNEYCIGHKLNSLYRGKNIDPFIQEIEELLDVNIDYYLIFDSKMLHEIVDAVGGVEVDVPIRMKYDDPTQDLHINLYPGVQVLNGEQAEHFVRYRKGNDGSGYARGDLERTEVQQQFIKKFISTVLSTKNLTKIPDLVEIALNNTDTNITAREALKYSTDVAKIDINNINSCTAPGTSKYIDGLSYFVLDKEKTQELVKNKLVETTEDIIEEN
jgi:LCP family protein required for cell wall assembly